MCVKLQIVVPSSYFKSSLCPPQGPPYVLGSQLQAEPKMLNRVQNDAVGVWHTPTHFTSTLSQGENIDECPQDRSTSKSVRNEEQDSE